MTDFVASLPPWPQEDFSVFGPVEVKKRSKMQQLVGRFLGRNWLHIPHVTHHDEIDVTDLEGRRQDWNDRHPEAKTSLVAPVIKALALTLKVYPQFATSLDATGSELIQKNFAHIGVAVELPAGLLVPVIRDCDTKSVSEIATEVMQVAEKARTKGLSIAEMSGGCISISSLGHIGGTGFTPIVNAPEVAILGMTRVQLRPQPHSDGAGIAWRKMLPLSLSYDHRVINGADAARFVREIGRQLAAVAF